MKKNGNLQREKLYDGKGNDLINKSWSIHHISFKLSTILNNQLRNLIEEDFVNAADLDKVIEAEKFEKRGFSTNNYHKGNLEVYYLIDSGQIYFFSFGEFQPTRLILYLEAVYVV